MLRAKGKKTDILFAKTHFRQQYTQNVDSKIKSVENLFKQFVLTSQGHDDCMLMFTFRIGVVFQLRGETELIFY